MSWFRRPKTRRKPVQDRRYQMPEGIWRKCDACKEVLYAKAIQDNGMACPRCDFHFPISLDERVRILFDDGTASELDPGLQSIDPLKFKDQVSYKDRLKKYQERTGRNDAVVAYRAKIEGHEVVAALMDFSFMGGSLGSVVGEKITRAAEAALEAKLPLIVISQSGGARMQEGVLSLMQMAKINAALARLDAAGLPYISILTNPTTGGVSASYAMVGDVIMAEPGALIGFAGPRVIEQTIGQKLPEGFQRSEFLLEHGMVDMVVSRREMRGRLARTLDFFVGPVSTEATDTTTAEPEPVEETSQPVPVVEDEIEPPAVTH
ncbi:MAG: acetyl-CoA carboxylase, carboxyltransferase subunit beta [Acidobacteriota bacterium]